MYVSGLYRSSMRDDFSRCAECESRQVQKQAIAREAKREGKAAKEASRAGNRVAVAKAVALC